MLTTYFWDAVKILWACRKAYNIRSQRQRFWHLVLLCLLGAGSKGMLWFMLREAQDALGKPLSIDNTLIADYWWGEMNRLVLRGNQRQKIRNLKRMGSDFLQQFFLVDQILVTRKLHLGIDYTCKAPYALYDDENRRQIFYPPFYIQTAADQIILNSRELEGALMTTKIPEGLKPHLVDTRAAHQKHLDQQAKQKAAVAV